MHEYSKIYINECQPEERDNWKKAARKAGFRTTNSWVFHMLENFEDIGVEMDTGSKTIVLSSVPDGLLAGIKKPVARRIRKFINTKIKEQEQDEQFDRGVS